MATSQTIQCEYMVGALAKNRFLLCFLVWLGVSIAL